jgi:hypothetical protein
MYNYNIDTTMLPTIWLTWASTKDGKFNKRYWLNCKTGVKTERPESWMYYPSESEMERYGWKTEGHIGISWGNRNNDKQWVKSGSAVRYAYVKYHSDIDALEVAAVGVETTRKVEPHPWKYLGDRFFVFRDKTIKDQNGLSPTRYHLYEGHDAWNPNILFSMLYRLNHNKHAVNEFKKFIGKDYFTIGNGRCIAIEYLHHLQEWYKTSQRAAGKGAEQQLVDKLTNIPLSNINHIIRPYFEDNKDRSYFERYSRVFYFERVNDEWSVLRIFTSENVESYRMYISDGGKNRFTSHGNGGWIVSNISTNWYGNSCFVNKDDAIDKCKRIKYAMGVINEDKDKDRYIITHLLTILKMPELEQLAKLNCQKLVDRLMDCTYPKAELKHWAGEYYNEKEKNILKKLGLNKKQLDIYSGYLSDNSYSSSYYKRALNTMRNVFGKDLSHMDTESFKKYLEGLRNMNRNMWYSIEDNAERLSFDTERFIKNIIRLGEKNSQTYSLVNDTFSAARSLNAGTLPDVDWYFDDYSDIVRIHDALVALRNAQSEERRLYYSMSEKERMKKDEEKRLKIDEKRKKYEYEDDAYVIRLPKDLSEIITEGSKQSICIGGYTQRHANGDTNLFFLREKSNPDKPFYAIEMNRDAIVQIHGFGNKWLGNNPEAIPTVIRWLRKNGISCSKEILTCTARGYSRVNSYVAMPVVD